MSAQTYQSNGGQSHSGGGAYARDEQGQAPPRGRPSADADERTVAEMLSALTTDASLLMRKEVELAKAEVRHEAQRAAKGAGMLGAAGVVGHMALLLLSFALAWALAAALGPALGFLIVGVLYAAVAALLAVTGRNQLRQVQPMPEQTVETLKEDTEWARNRIK